MAPGRAARGGAVVGSLRIGVGAILAVLVNPLGELGGQVYFLGGLSTAPCR